MLVLGREAGEGIQIGDDIEIVILKVQGNKVRVGINAPDTANIRRSELPDNREHVRE